MTLLHFHDLLSRAAAAVPDKVAFRGWKDRSISWSEVADLSDRVADALRGRGVSAGDRVVAVFENGVNAVAGLFAISQLSAVAVPINARLSAAELDRVVAHCGPRALWFADPETGACKPHCARYQAESGDVGAISGPMPTETLEDGDLPSEVAVLLYTSGTTGAPKAAMISHTNLLAASAASASLRILDRNDTSYIVAPMSHVLGLVAMLAACRAHAGAVLDAAYSPQRLFRLLSDDVSVFSGPPQMHASLIDYCTRQGVFSLNAPRLRVVASGGAPLDPAWKRKAETFYGLPLQNGYGLTESTAGVCSTTSACSNSDTSVGYAMTDSRIRLDFDSPGADADTSVGEVLVTGPQVMLGYFRNPVATSETMTADGWLRTGDLGSIDSAGRLHIVGRNKELIIRSGFNVYPDEVQAALTSHPAIVAAGVFGHAVSGNEEIIAVVQMLPGSELDDEAIHDHLGELIAPYKRPTRIFTLDDMPRTPSGKLDKRALQELALQRFSPQQPPAHSPRGR